MLDTLAGIEAGEPRNVSETILLLASQLEEKETTLAQLKVTLCPSFLPPPRVCVPLCERGCVLACQSVWYLCDPPGSSQGPRLVPQKIAKNLG